MRVVVFGAGAMACLFAARLAKVAQVVIVDTWQEGIKAIRQQGILLEESGGFSRVGVRAEYAGAGAVDADFALVLVKSWQTRWVAESLFNYLAPQGFAVSLQNGLGNLEQLGSRAFPGTTSEGATLLAPAHVRACGSGATYVAAPDWVVDLLRSAGFECYRCDMHEAEGLIWGKLAINCGINPLTALLRICNGELLQRPSALDLATQAALECAAVARAKGIMLPFSDPAARLREVAERTAQNRSSMLQDVLRGAPTECDAINGAVVREGRAAGVATPVNEFLWKLLQATVRQS